MKHFHPLLGLALALLATVSIRSHAHGDYEWAMQLPEPPLAGVIGNLLRLPFLTPGTPAREVSADRAYTLFESGQVRPLAMSHNGQHLFALNTPDGRLEVFRILADGGLARRASIQVGVEPVAVAVRGNDEVWVVNHVSDSVSILRTSDAWQSGAVVRTLLVGDEPRDIVFAGAGRAFITTAHRGQNHPQNPQLTTPGVGRADVWVFNATALGNTLGGTPETILSLFTDTPRALAVSPDGSKVYAAGFHTGNRTASLFELYVPDGGELLGGIPEPRMNFEGVPAPETGIIVKWDGTHWLDLLGRNWDAQMRFSLPDRDLFVIDATANPPRAIPGQSYAGVGTVLFNIAVNPVSGALYVSNTEANNLERFEGPGIFAGTSIRGHLHESRITVVKNRAVLPRHLNKHINYDACCSPIPNNENDRSLAFPLDMQVSSNGQTLYVAALGSSKVGVFPTAALENDSFTPSASSHIELSGGGPTGLVLNEAKNRLYVLTRFDNAISIVNPALKQEVGKLRLYSPEPTQIINGRRLMYDARFTSSHGDSACASCHVFGDLDSLAWDLGNPDDEVVPNFNPLATLVQGIVLPLPIIPYFHPMKGPMTTQSLRGMDNHGPMHWRGDRTGADDEMSVQPDSGAYSEQTAFNKFNAAFPGLLGRNQMLSATEMQAFTDFVLDLTYPPNPVRQLDDSLTPSQASGKRIFTDHLSTAGNTCQQCHRLDLSANAGFTDAPGIFGTAGEVAFVFEPQLIKVPHFRNLYQKIGRFGQAPHPLLVNQDHEPMGEQIRGFGYAHDGSFDTILRFDSLIILQYPDGNNSRREVEDFFLAFDSNMKPIVGQQVTLTADTAAAVAPRIDLILDLAERGHCDAVARAGASGWRYLGNGVFAPDLAAAANIGDASLRASAVGSGQALTYTCAPPGSGERLARDRDLDGHFDGDERVAGTDPANPASHP